LSGPVAWTRVCFHPDRVAAADAVIWTSSGPDVGTDDSVEQINIEPPSISSTAQSRTVPVFPFT